jgi:MinD superfamily P-loop ATPase
MSPPLIKEVKKRMRPDRMAILDAPPGTSCPVVETVRGSGFTLLVTEPTPFGLYDLKLAVGVLAQLEIPCGVALNRADIGNGRVKDFLKDRGIPLLMEIPFDRRVAEGYALGQTLLEVRPEWIEKFQDLFEQIKVLIKNVKHHG